MQKKWRFPSQLDSKIVESFAQELKLPLPLAALLVQRGYASVKAASCFLEPRLSNLRPPEEIREIAAAVERLQQALHKKERVVLYGDYDADGITSLAVLGRFLQASGCLVAYFLPERAREGYGLSLAGIERCLVENNPDLIVAIDCGTNSVDEVQLLRQEGVDVLIVDHHEPASTTAADAGAILVNPKLEHDSSHHQLCSAGLVFKLCHAFLKCFPNRSIDLRHYLDLIAIGTVADIAPLVGENRIFVRHGLRQLEESHWPGIQALISVAEMRAPFSTIDIGFRLGPRINAAGRLTSAEDALKLLLTDNRTEASQLARRLDRLNRERQEIERMVTSEAEAWVEQHLDLNSQKTIVVGQRHWHQGVVGIVASRLVKRWHRPTLVIGFNEHGEGKGSGRSIPAFPLVVGLEACKELLDGFGGHAMAAGLQLQEARLEALKLLFEEVVSASLSDADLLPSLQLDAEVDLSMIDEAWLTTQERLAPFGTGNPEPLFFARGVTPAKEPRCLKERHLRLEFSGKQGRLIPAIFFNGALQLLPEYPWDLAFTIDRNRFQGRSEPQMKVLAVRSAA
jgi:single-stranded-DNA-specific exonuclease